MERRRCRTRLLVAGELCRLSGRGRARDACSSAVAHRRHQRQCQARNAEPRAAENAEGVHRVAAAAGEKPEIARGTTFECPLAGDGTWTCELPAATLDLAVGQKGFTPTYLWGVKVSAENPVSVGAILMRRGASFTAWLDRDTMKALKHPARARLVRLVSPEATQMISRLSTPVAEGTFDGRGSVQLAPLPPGVYVLEVVAAGFATTRVPHVEIFEGGESTLRRPIELRPPLEVVVTVEPAAAADGQAWDVELRRENDFVTGAEPVPPIRGRVNAMGELHAPEVEPGTFTVVVRDRAGNRVFNRSYSVQSDAENAIHIKLDQHEVKGTVYLGDSPLKAVIWFGGEQSSERIAMQSDDDGKFSGTLPRRGDWRADVVWGDPTLRAQTDVSVPATGEVVVRLPDNRVRGVVKDERGERLKAGSVMAKQGLRVLVSPFGRMARSSSAASRRARSSSSRALVADRRRRSNSRSATAAISKASSSSSTRLTTSTVSSAQAPSR